MSVSPQLDSRVLVVEEAAAVLRVGRSSADALAHRWRDTGGEGGVPGVVPGRTVRVPRRALLEMLQCAPTGGSPT